MKLNDFMASVVAETGPVDGERQSIVYLTRQANKMFKANFAAPEHTVVRFRTSLVRDTDKRGHYFNLFLKLTPEHPCFRPYLRDWAVRQTSHICLLKASFVSSYYTFCQYTGETELNAVVDESEKRVIDRIVRFETSIHTVNEIEARHGLAQDDISSLLEAMEYMVQHSQYDRDYLLHEANRNALLEPRP